MKQALQWAEYSEYPGTHVGCIIVGPDKEILSTGYNGLVRGIEATDQRLTGKNKYLYVEHSERNALYNANRTGVSLKGASLFCTHESCADCARGIIQSGIKRVYFCEALENRQWEESTKVAKEMLLEVGVEYSYVKMDLTTATGPSINQGAVIAE
jgi:dCMP deaminase